VTAAAGSVVDGDVNDPDAPYTPNNTISTPQDIPNPVNVGGYVNQPGNGTAGRSTVSGDVSDVYRLSLFAGQQITLSIANATSPNDLDLFLGDINGSLITSSEGVGDTETIVSTVTGTYLVEVFAFDGASSYVLTISQATSAPAGTLSVLGDFIPGEAVARFNESFITKAGSTSNLSVLASTVGMEAMAGAMGREVLLKAGSAAQLSNTAQALNIKSSARQLPALMQDANIDPAKVETISLIKALRRRPDIEYAEPNYVVHSLLTPNDNRYPLQWHYPLINLPQAWDVTTGDSGVIVAVIDSGVILSHPDLQGQLIQGYDFVSDVTSAQDGNGIDNNPDDPGNSLSPGASIFHGTHVAGTIGAATNNITGVSGINWATSIMPLRALGAFGSGTSYDILQAVRYAAGLPNDSRTVPAQRADVINLSLGSNGSSSAEQNVYTQARNAGVIIVAAAGNDNSGTPFYPASYNGVVSVSAIDIRKNKAWYSNFGTAVDVAAPGGDASRDINGDGFGDGVMSTSGDDSSGGILTDYRFLQGTSMATPHVAGVAALMKAVDPTISPADFDNLLAGGLLTEDLGVAGRDNIYGHGLIDAHKAVVAAGGTSAVPVLVATPSALNFGSAETAFTLTLANGGGAVLSINTPTDDAAWLTVAEDTVDGNKNGTYTVTVDRGSLAAGIYIATITITSSANIVSVPVIMQVSSAAVSVDAGRQYILLIDSVTGDKLDTVAADATSGRYSYSFSQVPAGTYWIFSGSDSNNDGSICDAGESCGALLTVTQPTELVVDSDQILSDFPTSYETSFTGQSGLSGGAVIQSYTRSDPASVSRQLQR
jgi:serine protease